MAQTSRANKIDDKHKVKTKIVACDGGDDLPHPRVFLEVKLNGKVVCPYCSREFLYQL